MKEFPNSNLYFSSPLVTNTRVKTLVSSGERAVLSRNTTETDAGVLAFELDGVFLDLVNVGLVRDCRTPAVLGRISGGALLIGQYLETQ